MEGSVGRPKIDVLLLWGSSGAYGDDGSGQPREYLEALQLIEEGALGWGLSLSMVVYPGQPDENGKTTGTLRYDVALDKVLRECGRLRPTWLIGRSLGALLALDALSSDASWVRSCRGAVIWGPAFRSQMEAQHPRRRWASDIDRYRRFGTHLAKDFFGSQPDIESVAPAVASNLRFVRGTGDRYNDTADLERLALAHAAAQPKFFREVVVLPGLDHTPTQAKLHNSSPLTRSMYLGLLFRRFWDD